MDGGTFRRHRLHVRAGHHVALYRAPTALVGVARRSYLSPRNAVKGAGTRVCGARSPGRSVQHRTIALAPLRSAGNRRGRLLRVAPASSGSVHQRYVNRYADAAAGKRCLARHRLLLDRSHYPRAAVRLHSGCSHRCRISAGRGARLGAGRGAHRAQLAATPLAVSVPGGLVLHYAGTFADRDRAP